MTKQFKTNFKSFCEFTSLHGWHYMVDSECGRSNFKKIFWGFIVIFSMATASFFLYANTWDFMNSNVVTTVDTMTAPLSEVYFPSAVVCNINQVRESYFEEMISKLDFSALSNNSLEADLGGTHQLCKDMFIFSIWNGSKTYSFEVERDFGTDYGICCWYTPQFNFTEILKHSRSESLPEPDWGYWFTQIQKGAKTGLDNGFTILLDVESFDYKFFKEGSTGLKVALVHHLDMPIMRQTGFHISPGTENQIAITPTLLSTSPNAKARFSPAERDCYTESEIELKYLPKDHGYRYEMSNCLFEATFEHILERCKCFPGFHTTSGSAGNYSLCVGQKLTCVNEFMNRMGQFDHVDFHGTQIKCRSNCEDQSNELFVTSSAYPNKCVFTERHEFCLLLMRLLGKCKTFKRGPLSRTYPNFCTLLEELEPIMERLNKRQLDDFSDDVIEKETNLVVLSIIHHCQTSEICTQQIYNICFSLGSPTSYLISLGSSKIQTLQCPFKDWKEFRTHLPNCNASACELEDMIWRYARKNLARLNIFIKDPYAKKFMKDIKRTETSYIAKSGSILSVCMGFSFISVAEILFHCVFSFCKRRIKRHQRHQNTPTVHDHTENADYDWPPNLDDDSEDGDDNELGGNQSSLHRKSEELLVDPANAATDVAIRGPRHHTMCPENNQCVHICDQRGLLHLPPLPPPPPLSYQRTLISNDSQKKPELIFGPERVI